MEKNTLPRVYLLIINDIRNCGKSRHIFPSTYKGIVRLEIVTIKREVGNIIINTYSKTSSAIFTAYNLPLGVLLLL